MSFLQAHKLKKGVKYFRLGKCDKCGQDGQTLSFYARTGEWLMPACLVDRIKHHLSHFKTKEEDRYLDTFRELNSYPRGKTR